MQESHKYDDMLYMPHHQSKTRPRMSLYNRAAQFAPFAALTGYDDEISESGRFTSQRIELDENAKEALDQKLMLIMEEIPRPIPHQYTYYVADPYKEGGSYQTVTGIIKKLNTLDKTITLYDADQLHDGIIIDLTQIIEIH